MRATPVNCVHLRAGAHTHTHDAPELLADARVVSAAECAVGVGAGHVLRPAGDVAVRVELLGVGEGAVGGGEVHGHGGGREDVVALGDVEGLALVGAGGDGAEGRAHEHDERGVAAEHLAHDEVHDVHAVHLVHAELGLGGRGRGGARVDLERGVVLGVVCGPEDVPLLRHDLVKEGRVLDGLENGPRRSNGRGVLAGEEHAEEHAGDLVVGQVLALAGADDVRREHEGLEHVVRHGLPGLLAAAAVRDDGLEDLGELGARAVAAAA
jgi:hypothetical protein